MEGNKSENGFIRGKLIDQAAITIIGYYVLGKD